MKNNSYLFIITVTYFALGFVNIHFALLGVLCMAIPLVLLVKNKRKTWCQGYCPRASLYSKWGNVSGKPSAQTPDFFIRGNMKWIILGYFTVSMLLITISTVMVVGGASPLNYLRFFIVLPIGEIPQLVNISSVPWLEHLAYRFYSMMMSTTILGLLLGFFYKPRTWCTICPIATISDVYIKKISEPLTLQNYFRQKRTIINKSQRR